MAARSAVSWCWITGATAVQIKWNVSLVTRKFPSTCLKPLNQASFQTSTEALEEPTRYAEAKVVNTRSNAACRLLWACQVIRRWRKNTHVHLALCNNIKKVMKRGEPFLFDRSTWFSDMLFSICAPKICLRSMTFNPINPSVKNDMIFFSVTFSPGENETRDKFT